jgi:hypothetical protein
MGEGRVHSAYPYRGPGEIQSGTGHRLLASAHRVACQSCPETPPDDLRLRSRARLVRGLDRKVSGVDPRAAIGYQ